MHSLASFTSCTRKTLAPFCSACMCKAVVPLSASSGEIDIGRQTNDFREIPSNKGAFKP